MDRSMSDASQNRRQVDHHNDTESLPPWEQRHVAQVPYMAPDSPPLTQAEQNALQSLWATRENGMHGRSKSYTSSHDQETGSHPYGVRTPLTAPPTKTSPPPIPYNPASIAPGPRSAPQLPAFAKGPPSPPDSARLSRSSASKSSTPQHSPCLGSKPTITAMPGTMSARERSRSRHRTHPPEEEAAKEEQERLPITKRFRIVLRDIFKRSPVDETNFERIEDRHWADDE